MSQINWGRPLVLAVFLTLLGSAAFWLEFKQRPQKEEQQEESKKVFALKKATISQIELSTGANVFRFQCLDLDAHLCKVGDQSKWQLVAPLQSRADDSNLNSLLSSVANLNFTETLDLSLDSPEKRQQLVQEYRLDASARAAGKVLSVITTDGKAYRIALGDVHPMGENVFAFIAQGTAQSFDDIQKLSFNEMKVYLVPVYAKSHHDHDLAYWRDKKLFSFSSADVSSFQLEGSKGKVSARKNDNLWVLQGDLPGDIESIDQLLTAHLYLTAKTIASNDKKSEEAVSLLKGAKKVFSTQFVINKNDKKSVDLVLYELKKKGEKQAVEKVIYATVSNQDALYELDASSLARLDKGLKELRLSKLLTTMDRFNVKRIEFSGAPIGAQPIVYLSQNGQWQRASVKPGSSVAVEKMQRLLDRLSGNRIQDYSDTAPAGEAQGVHVALFQDVDAKQPLRRWVFWNHGTSLYAKDLLGHRKEVLKVDPSLKEALAWSSDGLDVTQSASPSPVSVQKNPATGEK